MALRRVVLFLALWAVPASAVDSAEPAICREAIATSDDPIAALRKQEGAQWRLARRAGRRGRKAMSRALAAGPKAAPDIVARVEAANQEYFAAIQVAQTLCRCRLARGAAEPQECERKYPSR